MKLLTGEDVVTCRHLYNPFFSYRPGYKILVRTNEMPRVKSQNYAMKRRVKLLPFRVRFYYAHEQKVPVRDETLRDKLLKELPGILRWAVEGCIKWRKDGLGMPQTMIEEVDSLFESMDVLSEFIDSECELHPGRRVESGVLWRAYRAWCEANGREPVFKQPCYFSRNLAARDGIEAGRDSTGNKRVLRGIGLLGVGTASDATDAIRGFSENSLMKGVHEIVSENAPIASDGVRRERGDDVPEDYEPGSEG